MNNYFLSVYSVLSILLSAGDPIMSKADIMLALLGLLQSNREVRQLNNQ